VLTGTVLALGGVVASASRAALVGALVGALVVLLAPAGRARTRGLKGARAAALVGVAVAIAGGTVYVQARSASAEAASSAEFRTAQVPIAVEAVAGDPVFGTGPGAASLTFESLLRDGGAGAFESFWLELAVGAGVPGLVLVLAVVVAALVSSLRSGVPEMVGALAAYLTVVSVLNSFEGERPQHLLLGLLLAMAFAGAATRRRDGRGRHPGGGAGITGPGYPREGPGTNAAAQHVM
jgi:O-antigen ligase